MDRFKITLGASMRCLLILSLFATTPAQALDFLFTEIGTVPFTQEQRDAFEAAGDKWKEHLADELTVNVDIQIVPLGDDGVLAQAASAKTTHGWSKVLLQMLLDADSVEEGNALVNLNWFHVAVLDVNGQRDSGVITLTTANAKALGLTTARDTLYGPGPANGADVTITLNQDKLDEMDFNHRDGIETDTSTSPVR